MELILWRHAEAQDADGKAPDAKRRLTARGEKQAKRMGAWLRERLPSDTRVLVSPSERTQQTAHALGLPFEIEPHVGVGADPAAVIAASGWPDGQVKTRAIVIVGHQPTLGRLAALLLSGQEADWSFKKGAVWWFSNRSRETGVQAALRAVINPEFA
jgi:phosphohistidine phosphatase